MSINSFMESPKPCVLRSLTWVPVYPCGLGIAECLGAVVVPDMRCRFNIRMAVPGYRHPELLSASVLESSNVGPCSKPPT